LGTTVGGIVPERALISLVVGVSAVAVSLVVGAISWGIGCATRSIRASA